QIIYVGGRRPVRCCNAEALAFSQPKVAELGPADAHCVFQNCREYRRQLTWRVTNETEHFGASCLLPLCLGQFTGTSLKPFLQFPSRQVSPADTDCRLRSRRTKLAAARWAICAFERHWSPRRHSHWSPFGRAQPRIEPINPNRTAR